MLGLAALRMSLLPSMENIRGQKGSGEPEFHFYILFQPVSLGP